MPILTKAKGFASKYVVNPASKYVVHPKSGTVSHVLSHTVVQAAVAEGLGYWHGKVGAEKLSWNGIPHYALAGLVGKLSVLASSYMTGPHNVETGPMALLNTASDAAIGAFFFADGVKRGNRKSGRPLYMLGHAGTVGARDSVLGGRSTVVGDLQRAVGGDYLDESELMELARSK